MTLLNLAIGLLFGRVFVRYRVGVGCRVGTVSIFVPGVLRRVRAVFVAVENRLVAWETRDVGSKNSLRVDFSHVDVCG